MLYVKYMYVSVCTVKICQAPLSEQVPYCSFYFKLTGSYDRTCQYFICPYSLSSTEKHRRVT